MVQLFTDSNGRRYDTGDVVSALREIGAADCETLFIHSDITFGMPEKDLRRTDYVKGLYGAIEEIGVKNLIVPTFTYSFCNHEDFDVRNSRTSMGALNEFIRKQPGRYRTLDPLLSLSVPCGLKERFCHLSNHSLGEGSGLDVVHHMDGVKFLFFGARQGECFTYLHYVEKMLDVPYRYDQEFHGNVTDYDGSTGVAVQYIHTHCYGVRIPANYDYFEEELEEKGIVRKKRLGNRHVSCISEKDAYEQIVSRIFRDPFYFVEGRYTEEDLVHKYGFGKNGERITHC